MAHKEKLPFKIGDKFVYRHYQYHKGTFVEMCGSDVRWEPKNPERGVIYYYRISNLLRWIKDKEMIIISNKIGEILYGWD